MESIIDNMNVCNDNNLSLPLGWDGLFKKVFGNEDKPQNVEMLLSLIFNYYNFDFSQDQRSC